jgi:hypothetical protein
MKIREQLLLLMLILWVMSGAPPTPAQEIRWLRITELQSPINEIGAEYENEFPQGNTNYFTWPAQYGIDPTAGDQNVARMKGLWIGCKNFNDPVEKKLKSYKVIGAGPRDNPADRINQIFEKELKLIGKYNHPIVIVDDQPALLMETAHYDDLDSLDENLPCDRMVLVRFNTSIGVSVTKKVMAFDHPDHGNYFIHDYVFKNTGIYNRAGNVFEQTLKDVWFYFFYRYAFAGVSSTAFGSTWGAFESQWGNSTLNHAFGQNPAAPEFNDPSSPLYQLRGFYSWYGPSNSSVRPPYAEDWGCPNLDENGVLGSAKYAGCVTLHVDQEPGNPTNALSQPKTTWFLSSDITIVQANASQYDELFMADRYAAMSEGHPERQHDEVVGETHPFLYSDPRRQSGGGTSQGQGFGPYTLAPGASIRIVFAEGVSGISWEKGREVGANWLQWRNSIGNPPLVMPDGSPTTDFNLYKRRWVETGRDSILQTFRNARRNYASGYKLPMPPPPPQQFTVTSGGNRILLTWADNATAHPNFDGYVIYRSEGNVMNWRTVYKKIFECKKSNVVHSFDDVTAVRGFDYYYYIQSKDDGSTNDLEPGTPLYSSMFWTMTSVPATLQRPAVPETPVSPDADTTFWKLKPPEVTWTRGANYRIYDVVTYNSVSYVCTRSVTGDTTTPDLGKTRWKLAVLKGEWVPGAAYNAYDIVSFNGVSYISKYAISAGKGLELVRVVPNPYDIRARFFQFGDQSQYDRIAFYGLPPVAKLKIFTERGDLIWEKDHTRGTGDELWDSLTSSGQIVASGIYILYVETPDGRSVYRKFVIIR